MCLCKERVHVCVRKWCRLIIFILLSKFRRLLRCSLHHSLVVGGKVILWVKSAHRYRMNSDCALGSDHASSRTVHLNEAFLICLVVLGRFITPKLFDLELCVLRTKSFIVLSSYYIANFTFCPSSTTCHPSH